MSAEPDFVYGGFASAFDEKEGRGRQRLIDAGIDTHLNVEECTSGPVAMSQLDDEIRSIGTIFGVQDRAEQETRAHAQNSRRGRSQNRRHATPVRVAVYDSGETTVYTAGGTGISNEIIKAAGATTCSPTSPSSGPTCRSSSSPSGTPTSSSSTTTGTSRSSERKQFLLEHPVLQQVSAIRNKRFAVLPLSSVVLERAGPRRR